MITLGSHSGCISQLRESGWDFKKIGSQFIVKRSSGLSIEGSIKKIISDPTVLSACSVKVDAQGKPLWILKRDPSRKEV